VRVARRLDVPHVTTFYGRDLSEAERGRRKSPYKGLFADGSRFVCEGPVMRAHLARLGAPEERTRVVPIGVDLEHFPFEPRRRTRPLVVVQAARLVEKKGFDLSIRAFAHARARLGPAELWIVGDGPMRSMLRELVEGLGIADAVRFHGMLSHREYQAVVSQAHICIQPSRTALDGDTEGGAPTVLLEMQALGVPIVATRHADIPFVVSRPDELAAEGDVSGLAAALVRISEESDVELRHRLEQGRAFVERRHDAALTAAAMEDLYSELLS
jgi:glycosyltransferase involved in cell wall biosynthesis